MTPALMSINLCDKSDLSTIKPGVPKCLVREQGQQWYADAKKDKCHGNSCVKYDRNKVHAFKVGEENEWQILELYCLRKIQKMAWAHTTNNDQELWICLGRWENLKIIWTQDVSTFIMKNSSQQQNLQRND